MASPNLEIALYTWVSHSSTMYCISCLITADNQIFKFSCIDSDSNVLLFALSLCYFQWSPLKFSKDKSSLYTSENNVLYSIHHRRFCSDYSTTNKRLVTSSVKNVLLVTFICRLHWFIDLQLQFFWRQIRCIILFPVFSHFRCCFSLSGTVLGLHSWRIRSRWGHLLISGLMCLCCQRRSLCVLLWMDCCFRSQCLSWILHHYRL